MARRVVSWHLADLCAMISGVLSEPFGLCIPDQQAGQQPHTSVGRLLHTSQSMSLCKSSCGLLQCVNSRNGLRRSLGRIPLLQIPRFFSAFASLKNSSLARRGTERKVDSNYHWRPKRGRRQTPFRTEIPVNESSSNLSSWVKSP